MYPAETEGNNTEAPAGVKEATADRGAAVGELRSLSVLQRLESRPTVPDEPIRTVMLPLTGVLTNQRGTNSETPAADRDK